MISSNGTMVNGLRLQFLARDSMLLARYMLSPVRPSVRRFGRRSPFRPSVCLSVTRVDQSKTIKVRIMQPSPQSSPMTLVF